MSTDQATAWPENVIARCVTAGGATVDIIDKATTTRTYSGAPYSELHELSATCTGALCPWGNDWDARATSHEWFIGNEPDGFYLERLADLRGYAERHAKKCHWAARPGGGAS